VDNPFAATAAALGYAYQFRYSLLSALKRLQVVGVDWEIRIEALDDIEISGTHELELLQLKHHVGSSTVSDASVELWKTLRVWSEGVLSELIDIPKTVLILVTTSSVSDGSAPSMLVEDAAYRNTESAADRLKAVAETSDNRSLVSAFEAFLRLNDDQRRGLMEAITVLPDQSDIHNVGEELAGLCALAVRRDHLEPFQQRLEGWWFRSCLQQLADPDSTGTAGLEVDSFFADLREQFQPANLPIDQDVQQIDVSAATNEVDNRTFIRQLELVAISESRIGLAVRDYLRAFTQRSRWSRDGLLLAGELEKYETALTEEWEYVFQRFVDSLGEDAAEDQKLEAAKGIYEWVESAPEIRVRPECNEPFIVRGSYQMLADEMIVGWHPDFLVRLAGLLEPAEAVQ
jgi:hypothetical protein